MDAESIVVRPNFGSRGWGIAVVVAIALFASSAVAEDGEQTPSIDTIRGDIGFGDYELPEEARLEQPEAVRGPVDRRHQLNPLADRLISWPSGYIAPAGSVRISNRTLIGQRLAVSVRDDMQLFAQAYLPLASQTYTGLGGQFHVLESDQWSWTMGIQGRYRRTNFEPGTADSGVGLHMVFDVIAGDRTTWSAGVSAHIPVHQVVEEVDFSDCETRSQWAEGQCGTTDQTTRLMPTAGHWGALFVGINHFVDERVMLNVEAFTGVSQGNFWALESALDSELSYTEERQLVEDSDFRAGLGPLGLFSAGLGMTIFAGPMAIQPAAYLTNYQGQARMLPQLSIAVGL